MTSLLARATAARPGYWDSPITASLIAQLRATGVPLVAPDGAQIAYTQDYNQRADLWVLPCGGGSPCLVTADVPCVPVAGGNQPLTGSYGTGFAWTPDSAALVYTGAEDGKLYRVPRAGGRAERLTEGLGLHHAPSIAPDGSYVACYVDHGDVDDRVFIVVQSLDSATPTTRRITPDSVVAIDPQVSPDSKRVACVLFPLRDRWAHEAQLAVVELATGALTVLTPTANALNYAPRWSPDGATIAFLSDRAGFTNVWLIPAGGGEARPLAPEDCEQGDPRWSRDGRRIAFTRTADADRQLMVAETGSGVARRVSREPGSHGAISWSPDGERLYALHHSPRHAPRVLMHTVADGAATVLATGAPGGLADPDVFVYPEHIAWRSTDGTGIYGLLYTPAHVMPHQHPALVWIHGGPTGQTAMAWDPILQYFVSRGWVVLAPNYRGSAGYGRQYADRLHGAWGEGDLQDTITGVNVLRERGLVDERRIAAWGSSAGGIGAYGGMMTQPGTFAAAIVQAGITDFPGLRETSDRYGRYLPDAELGPMADQYALWVARSPLTYAAQAAGPILILQGSADRRVPAVLSARMAAALEQAGKMVSYQVYDGEGHGWRKCATIRDALLRMDAFLTRYVLER
jgi:dipeptidyl aminopeptidase/acylaminoacyl peptidase